MTATSLPIQACFAICVLEDNHGRILLLRRAADRNLGAGLWGFPAGHIEAGESASDCARRELNEEIGPQHDISEIAHIGPVRDQCYGGIYEVDLFHFRWHGGEIMLNGEHTDHVWIEPESCEQYAIMPGIRNNLVGLGLLPGNNPYA